MLLLINPPLNQLNAQYPAVAQLAGFLQTKSIVAKPFDLNIRFFRALFSKNGLRKVTENWAPSAQSKQNGVLLKRLEYWIEHIDNVVDFLSGEKQALAHRYAKVEFWMESKRMTTEEELEWAFGSMGTIERAKHLCTLFLKDISDFLNQEIDPQFEMIKYAEKICTYLPSFDPLEEWLNKPLSPIEALMIAVLDDTLLSKEWHWIGLSVAFPGNLLPTLRCAARIRQLLPKAKIILGGGYVNTELRALNDPRIFDYVDYITFDDGELPLYRLLTLGDKVRTLYREEGKIIAANMDSRENVPFSEIGAPLYALTTGQNIDLLEGVNPMHTLWSNGKWNKMMLSHGCYWGKCAFCDVSLDYIARFEQTSAKIIVDRMEAVIAQTGERGFHFVDEAASPAMLRKLSEEILSRKLMVTYWTNVRFEKSFSDELCALMARSGCIAVSGGLEVASTRILKLINKGITLETAALAMNNFASNGIMTHAYLMYGFPTQTVQETIDSLEVVRQLFELGLIQSAFWHRFAMTAHAPTGLNPDKYGACRLNKSLNPFANNEVEFTDHQTIPYEELGDGLNIATYNFMRGAGFELSLNKWFKIKVPRTTHSPYMIEHFLA